MNSSKNKYIDYIFIVLLLLNGGSVLKTLGFTAILQFVTALIMLLCLLLNGRILIHKTGITLIFLIFCFFVLNSAHYLLFDLDSFFSNQFLNFIVLICIGVFVGNQFLNRSNSFIYRLEKVLKFFIIHGILSCLIISFFPTKNILFEEIGGGSAYVGYFNVFFQRIHVIYTGELDDTLKNILGFDFYRAHGIFWESGVFAFFVNIYVFINFFIFKKLKSLKYSLPAILLSWSTTGIIIFAIQSFVFLKDYKRGNKQVLIRKYLFGFLGLSFLLFAVFQNFNNKVYGDDAGSAAQRYADTVGALSVISNFPLLGIGVDFQNLSKQLATASFNFDNTIGSNFKDLNKDDIKLSNSFLRAFIYFGIPVGLFLIYAIYKQRLIPHKRWLFFLITVLSVSSVPILFLGFYFSFIISGLRDMIFKQDDKNLIE